MTARDRADGARAEGPRVAVLGGTGFLGRRVVDSLLGAGARVTLAARNPQAVSGLPDGEHLRRVKADIRDRATLDRALDGADATVDCVGLYRERRGLSFADIHVDGARRWAEAAAAAGVRRLVLVSGIGADPHARDAYVRARGEGEAAVRCVRPDACIVRPSVMFSHEGAFIDALADLVRQAPVVPLFGRGQTRLQPVDVEDVATAIARILTGREAPLPLYELGGPHTYTFRDLVQRVATRQGLRRPLLPVPFALWRAAAAVAQMLPAPPVTTGQVALMERDNVVGEGVGTFADLGIRPRAAEELGLI
ncbi:MAG TPA: complex I NDUFA9 subunit family protein [Thermohalobaculum sp.]|nr:complex I NDUFA9 subunit family protein [Thermohalobaculum sp.]